MSSSSCSTFQRPLLYWTTLRHGLCPFGSKTCLNNLDTMVLDTGLIDSHNNLGINADYNDHLSYRRVTNCTLLNDAAFMTGSVNQTVTGWVNRTDGTGTQPSLKVTYASYRPIALRLDGLDLCVFQFCRFLHEFLWANHDSIPSISGHSLR